MSSYLRKLALFLLPLMALCLVELFLLPINFFTFRCWEAVYDAHQRIGLPGPFYPNQHIIMYEAGDKLGFRDNDRQIVEWFTDEYGFRNRPSGCVPERYDFVLLGDCNIAGTGLDQRDTLAEVLVRKSSCTAYSYGSSHSMSYFWSDPRFLSHPPKTIVAEALPGNFHYACRRSYYATDRCELPQSSLPMWAQVARSRVFYRQNMLNFVKSRIGSAVYQSNTPSEKELSTPERVELMLSLVLAMQKEARRRGSDFIFFLMPTEDRSLRSEEHTSEL